MGVTLLTVVSLLALLSVGNAKLRCTRAQCFYVKMRILCGGVPVPEAEVEFTDDDSGGFLRIQEKFNSNDGMGTIWTNKHGRLQGIIQGSDTGWNSVDVVFSVRLYKATMCNQQAYTIKLTPDFVPKKYWVKLVDYGDVELHQKNFDNVKPVNVIYGEPMPMENIYSKIVTPFGFLRIQEKFNSNDGMGTIWTNKHGRLQGIIQGSDTGWNSVDVVFSVRLWKATMCNHQAYATFKLTPDFTPKKYWVKLVDYGDVELHQKNFDNVKPVNVIYGEPMPMENIYSKIVTPFGDSWEVPPLLGEAAVALPYENKISDRHDEHCENGLGLLPLSPRALTRPPA